MTNYICLRGNKLQKKQEYIYDKLQKKWEYTQQITKTWLTETTMNYDFSCDAWGHPSWRNFSTSVTHLPHPQMLSAHMCTDCSMKGWWPFCATLNPTLIHPLDAPQLKAEGYCVGWDSHLWSLWPGWRRGFWCQFCFTVCRIRDFRCHLFGLLRGWLRDSSGRGRMAFLGGVGWRKWECEIWLPSRAHRNPLLLILPPPTQFSIAPLTPTTGLHFSECWPSSTSSDPEEEKKWDISWGSNLNTRTVKIAGQG